MGMETSPCMAGDCLRQIRALNHIGRRLRLRPPAAPQLLIGRCHGIL
jgi:hypothetical protein